MVEIREEIDYKKDKEYPHYFYLNGEVIGKRQNDLFGQKSYKLIYKDSVYEVRKSYPKVSFGMRADYSLIDTNGQLLRIIHVNEVPGEVKIYDSNNVLLVKISTTLLNSILDKLLFARSRPHKYIKDGKELIVIDKDKKNTGKYVNRIVKIDEELYSKISNEGIVALIIGMTHCWCR
jgi:hypothetical protein